MNIRMNSLAVSNFPTASVKDIAAFEIPAFYPAKKAKNNATFAVKNGISFHRTPAMLMLEIAGVFRSENA
jgi:hypothetical protein